MAELRAVKGPYEVVYETHDYPEECWGSEKVGIKIGNKVVWLSGIARSGDKIPWHEEQKANAHLLAASWEMDDVLGDALDALRHCFHAHDSGVDGICLRIEAVRAKARGEAT